MITPQLRSTRSPVGTMVLVAALTSFSFPASAEEATGTLQLTIKDATTGEAVPARVEIQGADGSYHVASDALQVGGDCDMSDQGAGFVDLASTLAGFSDRIHNPYAMSTQFYSGGSSSIQLPRGPATIKVFKGPEYKVPVETVENPAAGTVEQEIKLARWINMPQRGWYSADDHLHIPRPAIELNPYISKMMQAEDIHVANLLQMGKVMNVTIALQHAHGPDGYYQEGDYILAAGQENPRTHFLGHTITLGAPTFHHNPDKYLKKQSSTALSTASPTLMLRAVRRSLPTMAWPSSCRTTSSTASRFVRRMVSSSRRLPTYLPVLTSMATSASVWLSTM